MEFSTTLYFTKYSVTQFVVVFCTVLYWISEYTLQCRYIAVTYSWPCCTTNYYNIYTRSTLLHHCTALCTVVCIILHWPASHCTLLYCNVSCFHCTLTSVHSSVLSCTTCITEEKIAPSWWGQLGVALISNHPGCYTALFTHFSHKWSPPPCPS